MNPTHPANPRLPRPAPAHARLARPTTGRPRTGGAQLAALAALNLACAGTPPTRPACPACPPARCPEATLIARDGDLYVKDLPVDLPRTAFLYALDPVPLPGGTRPAIGLLHVVEPASFKVAWFCKPGRDLDAQLATNGVPVQSVKPDTLPRMRGCWARFKPRPAPGNETPDPDATPDTLRLTLDIGTNDGVLSGDQYEVLGPAELDLDSRAGEFPVIGHCTVVKKGLSNIESSCLLNRRESPRFQDHHALRGGHVHLYKKR